MTGLLPGLLLVGAVRGAEPVLEAHGVVWAGNDSGVPDPGGGLGGAISLRTQDQIDAELLAEAVGTRGADTEAHLLASAWLRLVQADTSAPSLWLGLGMGALVRDETRPVISTAARLELPFDGLYRLRVEGRILVSPGLGVQGVALTVGPAIFSRADPPAPAAAPAATPAVRWPAARLWIDHPHCGWYEASQTPALIARYGEAMPVQLRAEGYLPLDTTLGQVAQSTLTPAPPQGALVLVAHPGDLLTLGGDTIATDEDGVAVLQAAVGPVEIVGTGGGRQVRVYAAVSRHHSTWVRLPEPEPSTISFAVDSASLLPLDRQALLRMGTEAGGWSFTVQGFASPEGNAQANLDLAARRADVVERVLREAGLPPERIHRLPPAIGDPNHLPNWGRIVIVSPIQPDDSP